MPHQQSRASRNDSKQRRGARPGGGTAHPRESAGKGSGTEGQGPSATATSAPQPAPAASFNLSDGVNGQARGHAPRTYKVPESSKAQQNTPSHHQVSQVSHTQSGMRSSNGTVVKPSRSGTPSSSSVSVEAKPVIPKPEATWSGVHPQLSFQFGSIGPSVGMYVQIPARTNSAPPNLDEQKQAMQSMAVPPLMGPPLASMPAPIPAPMPATQISHQLPGGLAPGMPVASFWVLPAANPLIPPRTSSAVKIVHPETHEELKFDYKSPKTETFYEGSVPVTVTGAISQSRTAGNGFSHTRPPASYFAGSQHSASLSAYDTQQNGHVYQPPSSSNASKYAPVAKPTSREETAGLSTADDLSVAGPLNPGQQTADTHVPEKESLLPVICVIRKPGDAATSKEESPGLSSTAASSRSGPSNDILQKASSPVSEKQDLLPDTSSLSAALNAVSTREITLESSALVSPSFSNPSNCLPETATTAGSEEHLEAVNMASLREVNTLSSSDIITSVSSPSSPASEEVIIAAFENLVLSPVKASFPEHFDSVTSNEETAVPISGMILTESEPLDTGSQEAVNAISVKLEKPSATSLAKETEHIETLKELVSTVPNVSEPSEFVPEAGIPSESQDHPPALPSDSATIDAASSTEAPAALTLTMVLSESETSISAPQTAKRDLVPVTSANSAREDTIVSNEESSVLINEIAPSVSDFSTSKQQEVGSIVLDEQDLLPSANSPVSATPLVKQGSRKKKMRNILAKADAAGTSADLYNAYKAPEVKDVDEVVPLKVGTTKASFRDPVKEEVTSSEIAVANELDDWEDAAELPTPKVFTEGGDSKFGERNLSESKEGETYTRDFLLTFKEQNLELPIDFEARQDLVDLLLNSQPAFARFADRDMHGGRMLDRQLSGGQRRSMSNTFDEDRWARQPQGQHSPIWPNNHADIGSSGGFRPGSTQGLISRMPSSIWPGSAVSPLVPGLIPGKPLTSGSGPGLFRANTTDSDRWQRMPTGQKGLIPSPHTPPAAVHKAEKRYEVGKVSDEEELKQRQIKGILNKLTPQNFQKLFEQVKAVNIQSAITLTGVISQIFDKALMEPTFCEMYATFCKQLATDMPEFMEDGNKVTFKRVLLKKCQDEFERGEKEQAEASAEEEDGDNKMSTEEREERRVKAKRRMLGNIRFIGELYKKQMLTERIMHECIRKLLGDYENPEEEDVEALCKLMSTIGYMIDQSSTREHMDAYLDRITRLSNNPKLSARLRFMLKDVIDLRRNGWQERRKVEGPKKIEDVHRDAVHERQATVAQAGRLSRLPSIGASSGRRLAPPELNIRGTPTSPMFAATTPMGTVPSMRGGRSPFVQDVRIEDRLLLENRGSTIPSSQRSVDEGL